METDDTAISVHGVSKDFVVPHERAGSLKAAFTGFYKRRSKADSVQHALRNINFEIKKGEFFGIVGRNGSGKSTMLKILANIYQPTKGKVTVNGRLVPFIELGVGFNPELTGRENVYLNGAMLGFSRQEIAAMYDSIVVFAELERYMDKKLKNYSSGMQVRLAFSMAIRAEADILLVDEVLAVGDADFQKKCYQYFKDLKRHNKTVVFVSHDMNAVEEYCDRALLIEQSKVVVEGTAHEVAMAYRRMFLEQQESLEDLAQRKRRWGNEKMKYTNVELRPSRLAEDETFKIITTASVNEDIAEAVLGFSVRGEDGSQLLGTNNKLKRQRLRNLKKGEHVVIEWRVANVLNSGKYQVDCAIQSEDYGEVFDWWEGAANLLVERDSDNPFPINPHAAVNISREL